MIQFHSVQRLTGLCLVLALMTTRCFADDGYRLWLKYDRLPDAAQREAYARSAQFIAVNSENPVLMSAARELQTGLQGLLGKTVPLYASAASRTGGIILSVTGAPDAGMQSLASDGYRVDTKKSNLVIASKSNVGVLYGAFALLRHLQTGQSISQHGPGKQPQRTVSDAEPLGQYQRHHRARLRRGIALEMVRTARTRRPPLHRLRPRQCIAGHQRHGRQQRECQRPLPHAEYIEKVAALAGVFRPYGIRVYLSVYLPAPKVIGGLKTADPLDPEVKKWWADKTKEIYRAIPDFGGFLVKANSEGEPGPQDYGRTHADGANMLAEALGPHDGIVMWRAFVYKADPKADRFKAAYEEFKPLDGKFDPKVIVQVKNGPIDFQPREPFSPLFGAMPRTPLALEVQITQEYLGFATHLGVRGADFQGVPGNRYLRQRQRLDGGQSGGRQPAPARHHGHCGRGQHRLRPQLDRPPDGAGQLVRLRPPGLGSHPDVGDHCRGMDQNDADQRAESREHHYRI